MSNDLLNFAMIVKKAAQELNDETDKEEKVSPEVEEKVGKEIQLYSAFIRRFLQVKGNDEIFAKLFPLFDNPRLKKPRNALLLILEKGDEAAATRDVSQIILDLKTLLYRYNANAERYPTVKLLKEVLNFGIANGIPKFKQLLSVKRKLYNTFNTESIEKQTK